MKHVEPARTKLFWLPIYKVVLGIIFDLLRDLWKDSVNFVAKRNKFCWILVFPLLLIVYPLLFITCVILFAVSIIFTLINYIIGGLVFVIDTLYLKVRRVIMVCPVCQKKYDMPVYLCPNCGAEHKSLRPGRYGVFYRVCECGHKLPSSVFTGRHKLDYKCPLCNTITRNSNSLSHDISIPVIGGPSSGKTCYINMAIRELEKVAPGLGLDFQLGSNATNDYAQNVQLMNKGLLPDKTNDIRLSYYQFYLTEKNGKVKNLVSLCDVAGEVFDNAKEISSQIGFKNAEHFLLIVDPLSIEEFKDSIQQSRDISKSQCSSKNMDEIIDALLVALDSFLKKGSKKVLKCDVAVVINKCDIPEVEAEIGNKVIDEAFNNKELGFKTRLDAINYVCRNFLEKYNETNFINQIESKFSVTQFFVCSALGHDYDKTQFAPQNVEDAILWLVDRDSKPINLKDKWQKTV